MALQEELTRQTTQKRKKNTGQTIKHRIEATNLKFKIEYNHVYTPEQVFQAKLTKEKQNYRHRNAINCKSKWKVQY